MSFTICKLYNKTVTQIHCHSVSQVQGNVSKNNFWLLWDRKAPSLANNLQQPPQINLPPPTGQGLQGKTALASQRSFETSLLTSLLTDCPPAAPHSRAGHAGQSRTIQEKHSGSHTSVLLSFLVDTVECKKKQVKLNIFFNLICQNIISACN